MRGYNFPPIHGQTFGPHERFMGMPNLFPSMYYQLMPTLPIAPHLSMMPCHMHHFSPMSAIPKKYRRAYPYETSSRKKSSPLPGILRNPAYQDPATKTWSMKHGQFPGNARRKRVTFADGTWPGYSESKHGPLERDGEAHRHTLRMANTSPFDRSNRDGARNGDHHRGRSAHTDLSSSFKENIPVGNDILVRHVQTHDQSDRRAHRRSEHYRTDDRKESRRHRCSRHHNRCHWISNKCTESY